MGESAMIAGLNRLFVTKVAGLQRRSASRECLQVVTSSVCRACAKPTVGYEPTLFPEWPVFVLTLFIGDHVEEC